MNAMASAVILLFAAFMALSLAMERHYRKARPGSTLTRARQQCLRCLGWVTLLAALLMVGESRTLTESLVYAPGLASLVLVPVALVHAYRPALAFPLCGLAWGLGAIGWLV